MQVLLTEAMVDFGLPFADAERLIAENKEAVARLGSQVATWCTKRDERLTEDLIGFYVQKDIHNMLRTGKPYIKAVYAMVKHVRLCASCRISGLALDSTLAMDEQAHLI